MASPGFSAARGPEGYRRRQLRWAARADLEPACVHVARCGLDILRDLIDEKSVLFDCLHPLELCPPEDRARLAIADRNSKPKPQLATDVRIKELIGGGRGSSPLTP